MSGRPSLLGRLWQAFQPAGGAEQREDGGDDDPAPSARTGNGADAHALHIRALGKLRVEDVMVPRVDIIAVEENASREDVMNAFREGKHSRLPVYRENLDHPLGFLHLKDLALEPSNGDEAPTPLQDYRRNALLVPPSMSADRLLRDMQLQRIHMALVIDEFGGVDGLVTIEDLVEELVGEIEDEHDPTAVLSWSRESDYVYLCEARTPLGEFEEACGAALIPPDAEDEPDTLGGLVFMLTGQVPTRGELIIHPDGHEFEILEADPRRIHRMRITIRPREAGGDGDA